MSLPGRFGMCLVFGLALAGCGADDPVTADDASTSTTLVASCDGTEEMTVAVDGGDTRVLVQEGDRISLLVACTAGEPASVEIDGVGVEVVGPFDVDGDGAPEILFTRPTRRGRELGAVSVSPGVVALTDLSLERWSDLGEADAPPFGGESYRCFDQDEDGDVDLVHWRFRPGETGEVVVTTSVVTVEAGEEIKTEVESLSTDRDQAEEIWSTPDGCGSTSS